MVCGLTFCGDMVRAGSSTCTKKFDTKLETGLLNYGGFSEVSPPRNEDDHRAQTFLAQEQISFVARNRVEMEYAWFTTLQAYALEIF